MDLRELPGALIPWYRENKRDLPWRRDREPYHIWVSEIMLQQTRVEAVKGYYARFLSRLPDIAALANCDDDELHKLWEGLGYYSRVRNLKKAARVVMEQHGGLFPRDHAAVRALPGIGDYTAGAICSIAFGLPTPAVDGNVLRVLSRLRADREPIDLPAVKKRVQRELEAIYPADCPGEFTQALMELGATVCLPNGAPLCDQCPAHDLCIARRDERTTQLPVKPAKKARKIEERTVFLIFRENRVALRRRPDSGLLAKLWEYPNELTPASCPVEAAELEPGCAGKHIFSHIEWHMRSVLVEAASDRLPQGWVWADRDALEGEYAVPNAFQSFEHLVRARL